MHALKAKFRQQQKNLKHLHQRVFNAKSLVLSQLTPYEVIAEYKHARVRYYASPNAKYKEPLVFVAPLAVNMAIYDLYPYRSLIAYFQQQGFNVYLLDWGKLNYSHQNLNFLSFIQDLIPHCIAHIQQHANSEQISLHGWSMAGIFVTLYTALNQPKAVKNLLVMGSPMDSYASGPLGKLFEATQKIINKSPKLQHYIEQGKIPKKYLHTPGILNSLGFKIIDPRGWINSQKQFMTNLHDIQALREHATIGNFLNHMVDYPGGINQDMVLHLWLNNPLKNGSIQLQHTTVELKNIRCSLLVGAGDHDQIVTKEAAQPLIELTQSNDVTFTLIPGGHLGLMSSQRSADEFWPKMRDWLSVRSTAI